jgi:type I restriction enzyme M protein
MDASTVRDLVLTMIAVRHLDGGDHDLAREGLGPALDAIVDRRPDLEGAFPDLPDLRQHRVRELLASLDELPTHADGDVLGQAYMHFLGEFARAEGRRGGQYYTPPSVIRLATALVAPIAGRVYDPCCGSGGLLVQAAEDAPGPIELLGQELNPATWRLARLNAAVHELAIDLGARPADTLSDDLHPGLRADRIVANPPFNLARWARHDDDARWSFGLPPRRNANLAWVQHIAHHLAPGGRAAVILANGSLTSSGAAREIRRRLVRAGLVEAVVALPDQLFLTTPIPASIWVLSRPAHPSDRVSFVDGRQRGRRDSASLRVLDAPDIDAIAEAVRLAREGAPRPEAGFSATVPRDAVARSGDLNPGSWVGAATTTRASEPLSRLIERARDELDEAQRLDEALRRSLDALEPRR